MRTHIVIIGQSPLSFLVARELDRQIGNLVHTQITWLTSDKYLAEASGRKILLSSALDNVKVVTTEVESVNFRAQRVITHAIGEVGYDHLLIDQTPYYSFSQRQRVLEETKKLISAVRAKKNLGAKQQLTHISVQGSNVAAWQLALDLKNLVHTSAASSKHIQVFSDMPTDQSVVAFLHEAGLSPQGKKSGSGLTIASARPLVPNNKIRGLVIGRSGRAQVDQSYQPKGQKHVVVVDGEERDMQNILSAEITLSRRLARNVISTLEGRQPLASLSIKPRLFLRSRDSNLLIFGEVVSRRLRASFVNKLQDRLWRQLIGKR